MSIPKDARDEVARLGKAAMLRDGRDDTIRTAVNELAASGVLARLARRNGCSEGTARQWVGKAVKDILGAKATRMRREAAGFSYTVLA